MWSVHQRLAEIWQTQKRRPLTADEEREFIICLDANLNRAWRLANLYNLSLMASYTNDTEWQHEICAEIEKAEK